MSYDLYTSLLKMHDTFRPSDEGVHLAIDMTAPELADLRACYALDSIAGQGSRFDRAVRIMDWLTTHVRHNGMCNPEGKRCARTALEYAFDQPERGVNCAWLAATLTECLLSLGIPARTVYIMPFAPYDCDNHVVTHLWTGEQWVMLDPTTNSYVMDKDGHPLDLIALRALLADQQEVVFSDGLRYNGQPCSPDAQCDYLAKDLFWFQLAEVSAYGNSRGGLLTVAPVGYDANRRKMLNLRYRQRVQGDSPWLRERMKALETEQPSYCSAEELRRPPVSC